VPLTVCVVIAGNYVPQLRFLSILLGDRPALSVPERIYQRLLAQDDAEVAKLAKECVEHTSPDDFYEDVLVPVLAMIERDRHDGRLSADQQRFAIETARELAEELSVREAASRADGALVAGSPRGRVLCVPAGDESDALVAEVLGRIFAREGFQYSSGSPDLLTSEFVQRVQDEQCDIVIISAVPPLATRKARYLCKRLRQHHPDLPILIGLWSGRAPVAGQEWLIGLGASAVVNRLAGAVAETRRILALRPNHSQESGLLSDRRQHNHVTV
jgi:methanogenic corrinoid protein MtbC1